MKAVIGIGNPGSRYKFTKHNVGFMILDYFAEKNNLKFVPSKYDYYFSKGVFNSFSYLIIKPTTFVNLSGLAAAAIVDEYKINTDNILVVTDDLNLNLGAIRIRRNGGDGGHNGIKSIIYHLRTENFPRLRFGIGSDFEKGAMKDYVLSEFSPEEFESINDKIKLSAELIEEFLKNDINSMLNLYSRTTANQNNNNSRGN